MTDHLVDTAAFPVELLTLAQRRAARGLAAALAQDGFAVDQWRVLRALGDGEAVLREGGREPASGVALREGEQLDRDAARPPDDRSRSRPLARRSAGAYSGR